MSDLHIRPLPPLLKPLANKFYRAHCSAMRAAHDDQPWVAQSAEIIAALCLRPMADGQWLTGLLVAPAQRRQGVARQLIERALAGSRHSTWLFCHPQLHDFYLHLGFSPNSELPQPLAQRLVRYQRNKALIAMARHAN